MASTSTNNVKRDRSTLFFLEETSRGALPHCRRSLGVLADMVRQDITELSDQLRVGQLLEDVRFHELLLLVGLRFLHRNLRRDGLELLEKRPLQSLQAKRGECNYRNRRRFSRCRNLPVEHEDSVRDVLFRKNRNAARTQATVKGITKTSWIRSEPEVFVRVCRRDGVGRAVAAPQLCHGVRVIGQIMRTDEHLEVSARRTRFLRQILDGLDRRALLELLDPVGRHRCGRALLQLVELVGEPIG